MVKQTVLPMSGIFSSHRFGKPQIFAAALLLVFVGECAWLVAHEYPNATGEDELARLEEGLAQWRGWGVAGTPTIRTSLGCVAGAWGTFGAVFTAIAVSHTLYAPREVVLWNWRRIVLLGVSLTLAVGSQFGLAIIIPVLLAFMLYLAPNRKRAAIAILAAAGVVATLLLLASYLFHPALFFQGLKHARFLDA